MKNYSPKIITPFLLLFGIIGVNAQQATVSSGGNATGSGGSVSYSIGQPVDKTQTGTAGTITQGVQQPLEIVTLSGSEFENIRLEAVVFPNPTVLNVTLKITNSDLGKFNYQLFDLQGRLLNEGKISNQETTIEMDSYPSATYLLKVNSDSKQLKTFKILKN
ncbi:MAG: T9SS type A sorting domain-containing protein [Flavobacterium sp.]